MLSKEKMMENSGDLLSFKGKLIGLIKWLFSAIIDIVLVILVIGIALFLYGSIVEYAGATELFFEICLISFLGIEFLQIILLKKTGSSIGQKFITLKLITDFAESKIFLKCMKIRMGYYFLIIIMCLLFFTYR